MGARIRYDKAYISVVQVQIVDNDFHHRCRQLSLPSATNVTEKIYEAACNAFDQGWDHAPIRLLGVSTSKATDESYEQYNLFDQDKFERLSKLNSAIDKIRDKYGDDAIVRACFADTHKKLSYNILKLGIIKVRIETSCCKKFLMSSLLNDISILHDKNQICVTDRGKSVCNDKAGSALHQVIHCLLDLNLGSCIYRRSCLIQNQDLIVCKDCSAQWSKAVSVPAIHCLHPRLIPSDNHPAAS